eukprot:GHVS01031193.1.p1 GENE.GHVS01031193.1~~GHVS01031193.1.p1  ORF type:complete len:228 (-),score=49.91 GHVS01031193.1:324-1007(-)
METYLNRINVVLCTFITAVFVTAMGNYCSSFFFPSSPPCSLTMDEIYDMNINHYLQGDQVNIAFSLRTDLRSVFNWNANQLFLYIMAVYKTPTNSRNEVVIWDKIIQNKEDSIVDIKHALNKYPLRDHARLLRNRKVALSFRYRYMPIIGLMNEVELCTTDWTTPNEYFRYTGGGGGGTKKSNTGGGSNNGEEGNGGGHAAASSGGGGSRRHQEEDESDSYEGYDEY